MERAQHCAFTRKCRARRASNAEEYVDKRTAMRAQFNSQHKVWFFSWFEQAVTAAVTALAQLVEECLDDLRTRAKRAKRAGLGAPAQQIEFLPKQACFLGRLNRFFS